MNAAPRRWMWFLLAVIPLTTAADEDDPLRFVRVHVPHGNLSAIDLGPDRYVPMSAADFEAAIAHLERRPDAAEPLRGTTPLLDVVQYEARLDVSNDAVRLLGTATWTVDADTASVPALSLGRLAVQNARMTTAAGTGDAVVYGRADGSLAISTPEPGTYTCQWRCPVDRHAIPGHTLALPLVPALASTIRLELPMDLEPMVPGAVVRMVQDVGGAAVLGRTWQIDVGPGDSLEIGLMSTAAEARRSGPRLTAWTTTAIVGRQIRVRILLEPDGVWQPAVSEEQATRAVTITLAKAATTLVTGVTLHDPPPLAPQPQWLQSADGMSLHVEVPTICLGRRQAFFIDCVAPLAARENEMAALPLLHVAEDAWAGGGIVIQADPSQAIADLSVEQAAVVAPNTAATWPTPPVEMPTGFGLEPARICIEQQGPRPRVDVAVRRRLADVSVERVTVVDVSPEAALGRTTCAVTVRQGEAFELRGWLTKGWFIDTVEIMSAPVRPPLAIPQADAIEEPPEWRVVREGDRNELRVAFTSAVTPAKPVMVRITGHRAGVAPGLSFLSGELDMITLRGETRNPVLAVKTGAEMTIDMDQPTEPVAVEDPRLAALVEESGVRVRLPTGRRVPQQVLRLARRRPPLDVNTEVRLTSRDGRLIESFTFECTPERNAIDSIVVHFSTVMDDRLEWQLLPPATGTVVARRIEEAGRRGQGPGEPIADSWVVELTPAAVHPVTIRAACTVAFAGSVPIPLAWVDGATRHLGTVTIREAGRFRPRVINHRLSELPPRDEAADQAYTTVAEFAYDARRADASDLVPAAELVPGGGNAGEDARAWAWREQTTVWCHASGATEYETRFDIENHGRTNVAFTLPPGLQLQGALVDGQLVRCVARGTGGGDVAIELPTGRRSLELTVRAMVRQPAGQGWWWVNVQGGSLDVPVLQRDVRVQLAPDVEIAWQSTTHRVVADASSPPHTWLERLFGASRRRAPAGRVTVVPTSRVPLTEPAEGHVDSGYRDYLLVPLVGRRDGGSLIVVDGRFIRSASIVAALVALVAVLAVPVAWGWLVVGLSMLAAIGSLWLATPLDEVSRAAWWAMLVGGGLRATGVRSWLPATGGSATPCLIGLLLLMPNAASASEPDDGLLRVFLTPVDATAEGDTMALVPEPLFRRLVRDASRDVEPRVVACTVKDSGSALGDGAGAWQLVIDVEADAGTTFVLDQRAVGGRVRDAVVDGRPVALRDDETSARIPLSDPGRHRIECRVEPGRVRRGQVEITTIAIPVAPRSTMLLSDPLAVVADCECSVSGGPFLPAPTVAGEPRTLGRFDISRSAVVRVVRPIDPRLQLAASVRSAESRNDLVWDADACRLTAAFTINRANEIVRAFMVRVDPGTACDPGDVTWHVEPGQEADMRVTRLDGARFLLERLAPQTGQFSARLSFRLPLSDPVGVFAAPSASIEGVAVDARLTQLVPAGDLAIDVRLPDNATAAQRDTGSSSQTLAWRTESVAPVDRVGYQQTGVPFTGGTLTVRRRQPDLRATQRLALEFGTEQIGMELQARIDAGDTPFAETTVDLPIDAIIDRVDLFPERVGDLEAEVSRAIDICWTRVRANQLRIVVQQPRPGRFRLEVETRLEKRASNRGTVAVMRADIAGALPVAVAWTSRDGRGVAVVPSFSDAIGEESGAVAAGDRVTSGATELLGGEVAIQYERGEAIDSRVTAGDAEPVADEPGAVVTASARQRRERVELADVGLVLDQRGRCWGSARFDVVTARPLLRLSLPSGMRLFETLVDGRPANAVPRDDGTWEIPLLATQWPRSVLAVFAGDMGSQVGDGKPFEIGAPRLDGLPCMRLLWTVRTPGGEVLRVADPARIVTEETFRSERVAAFNALADDFAQAMESAGGPDRRRLEEFIALRRRGDLLTAERPWVPGPDPKMVAGDVLYAMVDVPNDGAVVSGLALRIGRRIDPTVRHRALATLVLVAAAVAAWNIRRHWPAGWGVIVRFGAPIAVTVAGVAWLLLLTPWWPGVALLAVAAINGLQWVRGRRHVAADDESTLAQFALPAGTGVVEVPSTQQMPIPPR